MFGFFSGKYHNSSIEEGPTVPEGSVRTVTRVEGGGGVMLSCVP